MADLVDFGSCYVFGPAILFVHDSSPLCLHGPVCVSDQETPSGPGSDCTSLCLLTAQVGDASAWVSQQSPTDAATNHHNLLLHSHIVSVSIL